MPKTWFLVIPVIIVIYFLLYRRTPLKSISLDIKSHTFMLEVASTLAQKTLGLGKRSSLCPDCGMIFVNSFPSPQIFWMKDTLIPLDIIFLDKNGVVINISAARPEPGVSDLKLTLYRSLRPAQYVIELNQGTGQKLNLKPGDTINLPF